MSLLSKIQELAEFDTALVANTIGIHDPTPIHEYYMGGSIASMLPTLGPTVGVAVTGEVDTSSPFNKTEQDHWWNILRTVDQTPEPVVLVLKAVGSRPDHECILGDGMAKLLYSFGCIGAVTDGGVRDLEGLATVPFAVYATRRTIHHTHLRFTSSNKPIEIGGITVNPGDLIHANVGGVIKIPPSSLDWLPVRCAEYRGYEAKSHMIWRKTGMTLDEKLAASRALKAEFGIDKTAGR